MANKAAYARGCWTSQEFRKKRSEAIKAAWARGVYDLEWRQKKADAIKAVHARGAYGEEWRQKLSEHRARLEIKRRNSESHCGAKHPNWQGGISREPYGWEFDDELKETIRARDDYACAICGAPSNGRKLSVHHIDYDKRIMIPQI